MECVANPPKEGDPSYASFEAEKASVLESLAERAKLVAETFNTVPGMKCNVVQGAMYAFPQLMLPPKVRLSDVSNYNELYCIHCLLDS